MLEPQALLPLARARCRFALLVGDPKQLPPTLACEPSALGTPLFLRLAHGGVAPLAMRTQYRLHPALSKLASELFYDGGVLDGVGARERAPLLPGLPTLALLDTSALGGQSHVAGGARAADGCGSGVCGGLTNHAEAQAVKLLVRALLAAGIEPSQLGVICLYRAQVALVSRALGVAPGGPRPPAPASGGGGGCSAAAASEATVTVSTVDAFQGAERDVIIVSAARTAGGSAGSALAFVANPNRLCVALTRARRHLLLVCSAHVLAANPLWRHALRAARQLPSADAWGALSSAQTARALERVDDDGACGADVPAQALDSPHGDADGERKRLSEDGRPRRVTTLALSDSESDEQPGPL